MSILHVRNVPDPLYRQIQKLSETDNRSFSAEVLHLLDLAVHEEQAVYGQKKILASIKKRRLGKKAKPGAPDSLTLLREDRNR
jgi:plasmid stability protein